MIRTNVKKELAVIVKALKKDPDYFYSWQANIAVKFQDEWQKAASNAELPSTPEHIHEISNAAAKNFLDLLCQESLRK